MTDDDRLPTPATGPSAITRQGCMAGALAIAPLSISFIPFGLAFGVAAIERGMDPLSATLMSALVFGGASQFAALDLWTHPLPVALITLTVFVVNSRHLLYGAVLYPRLAGMGRPARYSLLGMMTDSAFAYAVQVGAEKPDGGRDENGMLFGAAVFVYLIWIASTWTGATLGTLLGDTKVYALDVVMVSYFAATLAGLWQGREDLAPWLAAALGTLAGLWLLPTGWYVLAGALAGGVTGLITDDA